MIPLLFIPWLILAQAQQPPLFCLPRPAMLQVLRESGHQHMIGKGPTIRGSLVEVYVDEQSGSWTIIGMRADGITCVLANGRDGWEATKEPGI